jgi:RNA polymerase sigma-32 factor
MSDDRDETLALYYSHVRNHPLLTAEQEVELATRWREHKDERAAHRLVLSNMRAVIKIASEFGKQHAAFADLVQEGTLGLLKAVDRYDPSRGTRFLSYAAWWVRAYIRDYLLRTRSLVRLGTTQRQRTVYSRLGQARNQVAREGLSGEARIARLEELIGVDRETILSMEARLGGYDVSLDAPVGDEQDAASRASFLEDEGPDPERTASDRQEERLDRSGLEGALTQLSAREQEIIRRRHLAEEPETLQQVGDRLGISRERVRQLEVRALRRMRESMAASGLQRRVA